MIVERPKFAGRVPREGATGALRRHDHHDRPRLAHRRAHACSRGARLLVALHPRAHAHPDEPADAACHRRGRARRAVQADARSVRRAGRRGVGHRSACGSAPASRSWPSAIRSSPRRRSPRSTISPAAASSSGSAYGWNVDEMEHHGVDPARRRAVTRSTCWPCARCGPEEAEFHGEFVDFSPSWSGPSRCSPAVRPC